MRLIDLSREISHREPSNPGAIPPQVWEWRSHEETASFHNSPHSSANRLLILPDHSSTHVDAPLHFDADPDAPDIAAMPLERFYGPAICIDVSRTEKPGWIDVADLERGIAKDQLDILAVEIVLLYSGHYARTYPRPEFFNEYPGLTVDAARWLHEHGVRNFGVEGPNPGHPEDRDFWVHVVCQETGMIHMEGLAIPAELAGQRFTFIGFPLKIRNGSGSPIRAVAVIEES
ncbi:MAG: cyclase family protein [Thermomicrobiales bacterium]